MTHKFRVGTAIALFCVTVGATFTDGYATMFFTGSIFSLACLLILANWKDVIEDE